MAPNGVVCGRTPPNVRIVWSDVLVDTTRPPAVPGLTLGRLLGAGSSGRVWTAVDASTGRTVAVKVLGGPARGEPSRRESALLRRLDHPHLLRLLRTTRTDDGRVALVTEHAPGGSLAALVRARSRLDPAEVVTVLTAVAGALADLHARGLVHGDVAPGNVLFLDDGRPVLADLGTAGLLGVDTATHATPGFADPAVAAGAGVSPASDVHALGALAWFALTGAPPQPAGSRPPLAPVAPGTPPALAQLVERCLDPSPGSRPDAARVAADAFDAVVAEPLRLVPTDPLAEPAEVLTHRLRQSASTPVPGAAGPVRPRLRALRRSGALRRITALRAVRSGPARAGAAAASVVVVAAAAALVLGEPGGVDRDGGAGEARTTSVSRVGSSLPPVTPPTATSTSTTSSPAPVDHRLVGDDPLAALEVLATLRAEGFAAADPAPLRAASVEGSPALAADLATLAELERQRVRLDGLAFGLDDARVESRDGGAVTVRVSVVTGAHRVAAPDGTAVEQVPASAPAVVRLVLRQVAGRWQVAEVR
jgi:hypothetical protein